MRDFPEATPKLRILVEHLRKREQSKAAQTWLAVIKDAMVHKQVLGGVKGWFHENDAARIDTLQAHFDSQNNLGRVWAPGRSTAVWNPFGVKFYSDPDTWTERKFHGVLTLGSSPSSYVGYDRNSKQVIVFRKVDERLKV